jgi:hypothetical protein
MDSDGRLPVERNLRRRLSALNRPAQAALLRALTAPDEVRAARIGALYSELHSREVAELLIDLER